jgi:hypothetical protein
MKPIFLKYRSYRLAVLLMMVTLAHAAIYKQVDAQGLVHFSDMPQANAVLVTLPSVNTYAASNMAKKSTPSASTDTKSNYKKLQITQPIDQQTLQNQHDIPITIDVQPTLQPHDILEIWLDGKPIQQITNTQLTLTTLNRGEHQLQVKLLDANKQAMLTAAPVTFYVQYAKKQSGER